MGKFLPIANGQNSRKLLKKDKAPANYVSVITAHRKEIPDANLPVPGGRVTCALNCGDGMRQIHLSSSGELAL